MNKRNYYSKISIILIVCMGISIFNPIENVKAATWTDPGTNIVWTYVASGSTNATKVYTSTTGLSGTVTVPSTINGLTVTSVGYGTSVYKLINNAAARANVTEVILPETVTTIEGYAFADHTGLTKITIPKNVTTLGGYAFQNCTALEEWTINAKNLSSIATTVLSGVTKLKTINIGEDVESINIYNLLRAYAAQNITLNFNAINYTDANKISPTIVNSVKILNIGPNVGKFSSNIYSGLNGLQEINYNATNATTLSASTYGLSNNTKVYIGENVINVPAYSFSSNNTTYYMLNKNTTLEENAITNPWSGTIYGWYNTPAHDYAIANGFFTFTDYDSYGTATENGIEWYYEKGEDDTLAIKPNLGGSSLSGDIIVPESLNGKMVAKISNNAFENANITNITLPNTITDIGDSAFASSTLSSLTLPTSVTNIGNSSFAYMNNIEEITIPEGVVILGENTFNASSLKRINLPSSLIQIGDNSLSNLSYLEEINIDEGNTAFKSIDGILYNKDMTQLLLFPKENAKTTYTIPNTITTLYANFLNGNSPLIQSNNLTELIIPKNVTAIGKDYNSAIDFYSSSKDIKVTILNKDVVISDYSIGGNSLTLSSYSPSTTKSYAASNYITFVEYKEVLYPYTILHKYNGVINEALTETGQATEGTVIDTFKNNEDASNVLVSTENYPLIISKNDNTMIINYESTGLAWKAVQKSLGGETGFYAYPVNANLASGDIVVPTEVEGNTIIGVGGFEGNTQILSVNIPEGIKYIFTDAFRGCENLTTVNLPSTIEYLGSFSFEGCENLNQINYSTIGNTYIQIGFGPFWNTNFTNFVIPENVNFSSAGIHLVSSPNLQSFTVLNEDANFAPDSSNSESFLTNTELRDIYGSGSLNFTTIYGFSGSTAKAYATANGRTFIPLDSAPKFPVTTIYVFDGNIDDSKTEVIEDVEGTLVSDFTDCSSDIYELSYTVNNPMTISSDESLNVREIHYVTKEVETTPSPEPEDPSPTPEVTPSPEPENPNPTPNPEPTPEITPNPEPTPEITPNPEPETGNGSGNQTIINNDIDMTKIEVSYTPIIYSQEVNGELVFSDISFVNNGATYVVISISGITNNSGMKYVEPNYFGDVSEWDRLGKKNSREFISPSLHSLNNDFSTSYTTGDITFKSIEDSTGRIDLGILPPGGSATYSLDVLHGKSFETGVDFIWNLDWEFSLPE